MNARTLFALTLALFTIAEAQASVGGRSRQLQYDGPTDTARQDAYAKTEREAWQWVTLEACVLADGTGTRVMLSNEAWPTDDCGQIYSLGEVYTGRLRDMVPVYRHTRPGGDHRLSMSDATREGEAEPELAFHAWPAGADTGDTVYGYRAPNGGWGYNPMALPYWDQYGLVEEAVLFAVGAP